MWPRTVWPQQTDSMAWSSNVQDIWRMTANSEKVCGRCPKTFALSCCGVRVSLRLRIAVLRSLDNWICALIIVGIFFLQARFFFFFRGWIFGRVLKIYRKPWMQSFKWHLLGGHIPQLWMNTLVIRVPEAQSVSQALVVLMNEGGKNVTRLCTLYRYSESLLLWII